MLWSSCPRSNQIAPSCTYTALLIGLSRPSRWSRSSRGNGERGTRWGLATLCRRLTSTITGAIRGSTPLSWPISWRTACWPVARTLVRRHHRHETMLLQRYRLMCCFCSPLVTNWDVPGIYEDYTSDFFFEGCAFVGWHHRITIVKTLRRAKKTKGNCGWLTHCSFELRGSEVLVFFLHVYSGRESLIADGKTSN